MAQNFKEVAHTRTDMNKFATNFDSIDWSGVKKKKEEPVLNPDFKPDMDLVNFSKVTNDMSKHVHGVNVKAGWWTDLKTGQKKDRNVGELLCLVHSEVSEAMEGFRKNLMDDKLPHRKMFEVELADVLIRIYDIAGAYDLDLGGAIIEKMVYNAERQDHKIENRMKDGGKSF